MLRKLYQSGFLLAVVGTLLFSLKSIFIKYLYQTGLNANDVLYLRMLFSFPIYLFVLFNLLVRQGKSLPATSQLIKIVLLGFMGYYLASLFDLIGLEYITAQLERISLFTYPFLIAVIAKFVFKQALDRKMIMAMGLSYSGLILVVYEELSLTQNNVVLGVGFVLLSALCFAGYVLFSKQIIQTIGSQLFTTLAMLVSCLFGVMHGVMTFQSSLFQLTLSQWSWLSCLVLLSTVIPSYLMAASLKRLTATEVGHVGMFGPVFTIVFASYLLNEAFTTMIGLGILLVMAGVGMTYRFKSS